MVKVLIIGAGGIGARHLQGYGETGRAVLSIVEPDDKRRKRSENAHQIANSYGDLRDAPLHEMNLAVICAPAHLHVEMMLACARANLPFMVEKPLAVTLESVDEVLALVAETGLLARVGYIRRVGPETLALRQQILDGKLGELRLAYLNSSQDFPKYRPDYQSTYYAVPEMGGGAILDAASHLFDLLVWIMGRPSHVGCMYDRLVLAGSKTEDTCLINIRFQSGAMANVTINQFQKPNTNRFEFIGTKGNLSLEHSTLRFSDDDSGTWRETHDYMQGSEPVKAHQARFALQANAMLDALAGGPCHLATLPEARDNLKIAIAAKRSWDEKSIIPLDPV